MQYRRTIFCFIAAVLAGCAPVAEPIGVSLNSRFQENQWNAGGHNGLELISEHYRIYTTINDRRLLMILPGFLDAAHQSYLDLTQLPAAATDERMPVYMLSDRMQWAELTESVFGRRGPSMHLEDGGYTYRGVTVCWNIGGMATLSVAAHEGMHQFLHYRMKNRLHLWAEEGLATSSEGFVIRDHHVRFTPGRNMIRLINLRQAILHQWLGMELLLRTSPPELLQQEQVENPILSYYAQIYALTNFLRTHPTYGPRWRAMISAAAAGRLGVGKDAGVSLKPGRGRPYAPEVGIGLFRQYITTDIETFEREFRQFARTMVNLK